MKRLIAMAALVAVSGCVVRARTPAPGYGNGAAYRAGERAGERHEEKEERREDRKEARDDRRD